MSMKNSNYTIGNRTHDLPTCSAVPQPTTPPRTPTNMSTRRIFWGVKAAGACGWQPYHLHVPIVMKFGSLNLLEPSGPVQARNGIALPFSLSTEFSAMWGASGYLKFSCFMEAEFLLPFSQKRAKNPTRVHVTLYIYVFVFTTLSIIFPIANLRLGSPTFTTVIQNAP